MQSNATVNTTGSALGGVLVQLLTAPIAIAVDALSFLLAAICKSRIRTPGPKPVAVVPRAERHLWVDIRQGLRAVFGHRILRAVTLSATLGALAGQMQAVVFVLYLVRNLKLASGLVGVAIAVGGVAGILGALMATPITKRIGPGPAFITGSFLGAMAGLVLAASSGPLYVAFAILVAAQLLRGIGPSLYGVNQQTFRQALVPRELVSRVNATWRFLVYGTMPIGALLGGVLGSAIGLRLTLIVSSGGMLLGATIALVSPLHSLRTLPAEEPPTQAGNQARSAA
jgi:predicted MFS family arabinose efflux permease